MTEFVNSVMSIFTFGNCLFVLAVGIVMGFMGGFKEIFLGMIWTAVCMVIMQALWTLLPHIVVLIGFPVYFFISIKKGKDAMVIVNIPLILIYLSHFL